jgi:hypothetical protein
MEHAETMLNTAEQLGAGLGASSVVKRGGGAKKKESQVNDQGTGGNNGGEKLKSESMGDGVGNAHLRLWIGERSLGEGVFLILLVALHIDGGFFFSSDRTETKSG